MIKKEENLYLLYMIFAISLVVSNCIGAKLFDTGITLWGSPITLTCGALSYPITFLCTDIISELFGKEKANHAVKNGFLCQIIATIIISVARYLPASDSSVQTSYITLLGQNYIFVIASLMAYGCSQSWDVMLFHKIRNIYIKKHGSTKGGKWIWNNVSTISSQLIDTIIYAIIAFGIGFGWLWTEEKQVMLLNMIIGQWIIKVFIAIIDTPFFYYFTKEKD